MGITSSLFNHSIDIYATVTNGYGDQVETLKYSGLSCRFQLKTGLITTRKGEEKTYRAEVYLDPTYTIEDYDRIVYSGDKFVVIGKENRTEFSGEIDHQQLYLA